MKILVIHGSMRKGNTYTLTKEIMTVLANKPNVAFTEINIADLNLPFCVSCHLCLSKGEEYCPHYETMRGVETALAECDGVIMSGTTYMWALNASMKNLLDHLAYGLHRPAFFGKKGMVITTSAGTHEKGVAKYIKAVLGQWGINGAIIVTQNTKEQKLMSAEKSTIKLDRATQRFYQLVVSGKPLSPSMKNIAVHNACRAMSLSKFSESERDTKYWQQSGFYDKAYPEKAGAFKYAIGAVIYVIAKRMTEVIGRVYERRQKS